jgi:hypothetical protein
MANIRVRVGQRTAQKVIASNKAAANSVGSATDVDTTNRANNTVLMYDATTGTYKHVDTAQIVDLSDGVDDDSFDAGTF